MPWWLNIPATVAVLCVGWWTAVYVLQDSILFPIEMTPSPLDSPPYPNAEIIKVDVETGGWVEGWFIPAPGVSAQAPAPAVLFFHGNAELIDHQGRIVTGYHDLGVSVLLVEYRGYGRSVGRPSQNSIRRDAITFLERLRQRSDVRPDRIIYHGRSLGGAVAADLAGAQPPDALILESTFRSVAAMAKKLVVPWFILNNPFETDLILSQLNTPALIFHGSHDTVIPVEHGQALRDIAKDPTYLEFPCDHNDFPGLGNEEAYWTAIRSFLENNRFVPPPRRSRQMGRTGA